MTRGNGFVWLAGHTHHVEVPTAGSCGIICEIACQAETRHILDTQLLISSRSFGVHGYSPECWSANYPQPRDALNSRQLSPGRGVMNGQNTGRPTGILWKLNRDHEETDNGKPNFVIMKI